MTPTACRAKARDLQRQAERLIRRAERLEDQDERVAELRRLWAQIVADVCCVTQLHPLNLTELTNVRRHASPRHLCWYLLREFSGASYVAIARTVGTDHSTVIKGIRAAEKKLKNHERRAWDLLGDLALLESRRVAA